MRNMNSRKTLLGRLKEGNQLAIRRIYGQYKQNVHFPEIDVYKSLYKSDTEIMYIYLRKGFNEPDIRDALNEYNDFVKQLEK